ncbi:class I SAM-dependent methyltransferase [Novosphingobium sp.]|uniref:class I SAM-dependent methyltransferase n=1 Tax=Novosphingobium sp. TaxID=1874826 RepID=UPI0031CE1F95
MATMALDPVTANEAAQAYDAVGETYLRYADGDLRALFEFSSRYSFADREIWRRIDAKLVAIRSSGRTSIRILDAGCGPGTWLKRCALRARALGFLEIDGLGFDISPAMIDLAAKELAQANDPAVNLEVIVADIAEASLPKGHIDIVLCLYGVLNHLPVAQHQAVAARLAGAGDTLFVTVRTVGSLPSIFVAGIEQARNFRQDNVEDRLEIDLLDGRHLEFPSHLFTADEFAALFAAHGHIEERAGLDLFHGRFAPDHRWNPKDMADTAFHAGLERLEHLCASDPCFIDRAAHVLLQVGRRAE